MRNTQSSARTHNKVQIVGPEKGRLPEGEERSLGLLLTLLGKKNSLDVGQDTSLSDGHARKELVELLIVADSQLQMARNNPGLLVVPGSVTSQLENLSSEVFHNSGKVDWRTSTHTLSVVALAEETVNPPHRELKPSTAGPALRLPLNLATLASSAHDYDLFACEFKIAYAQVK
jgi:hypothetical protein